MNAIFLLKGELEGLPPMLPRLLCLAERGLKMQMVCTRMTEENRQRLTDAGIMVYETRHNTRFLHRENRLLDWKNFRLAVKKHLKAFADTETLLYVCSADTALCLGSVLKGKRYVLQSNELYDRLPMYRKGLKRFMREAAAVVVPEFSRANICAYWYGLEKLPFVIPNVPYMESTERCQTISDPCAAAVIEGLKGRKILIYQGHISGGDRSLHVIAEALAQISDSAYALVLMGRDHDGSVQRLKSIYQETYYIPYVSAPKHLQITSHGTIGILSYDRVSMNNLFCAPNKVYEYTAYGIPMLGNHIPGLKYCFEQSQIGVCADYENVKSVADAILQLDREHDRYSVNAQRFFDSTDFRMMMDGLLEGLKL